MCDSRSSDVLEAVNDSGWADSEGRSTSLAPCCSVCSFLLVRFQDTAEHVSLSAVQFCSCELMMQRCRSVWMADEPQHGCGSSPCGSLLLPTAAQRRAAPSIVRAPAPAASCSWSQATAVFTGVFTHIIPAALPHASPVGLATALRIPARRSANPRAAFVSRISCGMPSSPALPLFQYRFETL